MTKEQIKNFRKLLMYGPLGAIAQTMTDNDIIALRDKFQQSFKASTEEGGVR